tara:strand:- start:90 stop:920 length:831 start_codon:yes stop_codon:yes gene_type:complete
MKQKISSISGVTLIEILIGILISVIMMGAMFTSYSVVNSTYSQVSDRAKISRTGRDVLGMVMRDVRMAGYKYFGDDVQTNNEHIPILITKSTNFNQSCDKIDIVYGDYDVNASSNKYTRYKITYECLKSTIPDKSAPPLPGNKYPPIDAFAIYKSKVKWNKSDSRWYDPLTDNNDETYPRQLIVDYVQDLIFNPLDDNGLLIKPPPNASNSNKDKIYKIKTVDIALTVRSTKDFFKSSRLRKIFALADTTRDKKRTDKILRESIIVTAHARNLGMQ